jgi:hypothetical protein
MTSTFVLCTELLVSLQLNTLALSTTLLTLQCRPIPLTTCCSCFIRALHLHHHNIGGRVLMHLYVSGCTNLDLLFPQVPQGLLVSYHHMPLRIYVDHQENSQLVVLDILIPHSVVSKEINLL